MGRVWSWCVWFVLVGELFIPLAWCGEGDMGLRARVVLRLSGSPLSDITGWVTNYATRGAGGVGSGATGPSPFTLL